MSEKGAVDPNSKTITDGGPEGYDQQTGIDPTTGRDQEGYDENSVDAGGNSRSKQVPEPEASPMRRGLGGTPKPRKTSASDSILAERAIPSGLLGRF